MKVWEKINEMKGSSVGKETILNWMVCNKICPLDVMEALGESYDRNFQAFGERHCDQYNDCSPKCYEAFLDKEYAVALNIGDMKPCPFCGSDEVSINGERVPELALTEDWDAYHFWVKCHYCGASISTGRPQPFHGTPAEAAQKCLDMTVRQWNRRKGPAEEVCV